MEKINRYHEAMITAAGPDCRTKLLDTRKVSLVFFSSRKSWSFFKKKILETRGNPLVVDLRVRECMCVVDACACVCGMCVSGIRLCVCVCVCVRNVSQLGTVSP